MIDRFMLATALLGLCCPPSSLFAGERCCELLRMQVPDCIRGRCCDNYCPKPTICPQKVRQYCCDDYRPKMPSCPTQVRQFCCDDYCPKPFPRIFCPPCDHLKFSVRSAEAPAAARSTRLSTAPATQSSTSASTGSAE